VGSERNIQKKSLTLGLGILVFFTLYLTSCYRYLLFHSLAEIFSVVIACSIFVIAWNSRQFLDNNYFLFIGIAYLFVGSLDLLHTLAYKGMGVFQGYETNLPTQLWIASRYMESLSFLFAPLFLKRKLKVNLLLLTYTAGASLLLMSIFYWEIFPACFVEGVGLTPFKKISEYIISLILLGSMILLLRNRGEFDKRVLTWVVWSLLVTIASELAFTFYIDAYGFSNLIGHFFKILSFYFIYKAIIETGLSKPYNLLFRNLKRSEETLREERERAQKYLDIAGVIIVVIKADQTIALINKKGCETVGYQEADVLGKNWFDTLLPERERARGKEDFAKLVSGEMEPNEYLENSVLTRNGEERIIAWNNSVLRDERGNITGILSSGEDMSERKQMERELAHLASFPELNPGPIVEMDLIGHVHYTNRVAKKLFPDLQSTCAAHPWLPDLESFTAILQETPETFHNREMKIGNVWYEQSIYYSPEWDRIWIYGRDITERKRTEEALRQTQQKTQRLFDSDLIGIVVANPEKIIEANDQFLKIIGYSHEDMLSGRIPWHEVNPPEYNPLDEVALKEMIDRGSCTPFEKEYVRKDGSRMPILIGATIVEREPLRWVCFVLDMTEHKRAEEKIKESERKYRELYEGSQDGYVRVDMGGNIKEFNSAYQEMLGYSEEELIELAYIKLTPEKWRSMEAEIINEQVLLKGYSDVYEKEYIKKNGTSFPISLRTYLVKDENGHSQGMWAFVRDISKRKEMEAGLRRAHDGLEIRVRERTGELAKVNEELRKEIVERKRIEEVLFEQGRILDAFFTSTITPLALLDKDFNFIRVNSAYARTCQRDISKFPGHNHFEFYPSDAKSIFEEVVETKKPYQVIARSLSFPDRPDWGETYWDWNLTPILGEKDDKVEYLIFSLNDVTERKRAEKSLEEAERKLRLITESMTEVVLAYDMDRRLIYVNPAVEKLTGYSVSELYEKNVINWLHPDDAPKMSGLWEDYFENKAIPNTEFRIVTKDGKIKWCQSSWSGLYDENLSQIGIVIMDRDITERKAVELERLRLVTAIEQAAEGIVILGMDGTILFVNPAFENINHLTLQEVLGQTYDDILQIGMRGERIDHKMYRTLSRGEVWNGRLIRKKKDGTLCELDVTISPVKDPFGTPINYVAVERDVTEKVKLQERFRQAQKMEALGTLAGGIAHDFNNILMPIVINAELALLDIPEGSTTANYLKLVQEAANRGKDLVKQIITFSRQKEQVKAPVEIGPVLKEALKLLRSSIPKNIEIREHIEAVPNRVLADPTQIHQILMNLCSNAAYAMREKGGILHVSLNAMEVDDNMVAQHQDLNPGPHLSLTVSDTGHGMDKEMMERIFDPFFTTKKPGEGTGMGLAVVHGIVKNHGGAITAYSEVGKGSIFKVFLPRMKDELEKEVHSSKPTPAGKERILLIDDEEIQIRSVQPMLERLGYRVIAKTEALEALEIFRSQPDTFDLVITDQAMPHMTGRDLAQELLRIRSDIAIILCTGFSEVILEEEAKILGIREFLMKPYSVREMAERIRRALGGKG
jgi:PAS domain S-box-containing protein